MYSMAWHDDGCNIIGRSPPRLLLREERSFRDIDDSRKRLSREGGCCGNCAEVRALHLDIRKSSTPSTQFDSAVGNTTLRAVTRRIIPFLFVLYVVSSPRSGECWIRRPRDESRPRFQFGRLWFRGRHLLHRLLSLFEVPSNLILSCAYRSTALDRTNHDHLGDDRDSTLTLVRGPVSFYALRFLLGVAEAGFFPGIIFYLSEWFPSEARARAVARFMIGIPVSGMALADRFLAHYWASTGGLA